MTLLHWISTRKKAADLKETDDKVTDKLIIIIYLKCGITRAATGLWFTSRRYHHIWEQCWICKKRYKQQSHLWFNIQTLQKHVMVLLTWRRFSAEVELPCSHHLLPDNSQPGQRSKWQIKTKKDNGNFQISICILCAVMITTIIHLFVEAQSGYFWCRQQQMWSHQRATVCWLLSLLFEGVDAALNAGLSPALVSSLEVTTGRRCRWSAQRFDLDREHPGYFIRYCKFWS